MEAAPAGVVNVTALVAVKFQVSLDTNDVLPPDVTVRSDPVVTLSAAVDASEKFDAVNVLIVVAVHPVADSRRMAVDKAVDCRKSTVPYFVDE